MKKLNLSLLIILFAFSFLNAQSESQKYSSAMEFFHKGDFANALPLFKDISSTSDENSEIVPTVKFYEAECLINLHQLDGAAARLEEFVDNYRYSNFRDLAFYRLGTIYYNQGLYQKSRDNLIILMNEYPNSDYIGAAYYWIGEAFVAENKFLEAEEFLKEAISKGQENRFIDYSIFSLANLYERQRDYTNAVTYYDELLAYYRNSDLAPNAQLRIGVSYFNMKEYDHAVLELSDPLINKLSPELQTEASYYLANSFFRLKDYKNAEDIYNKLMDKYSDESMIRQIKYGLAWVNFQKQEYNEAYYIFESLAQSGKDTVAQNSLFWSAECKRYEGKTNEALNIYNDFLKQYPNSKIVSKVRFNAGTIYYGENDVKNAERFLILSLSSEDNTVKGKAFALLGEISLNKKDYSSAENYFTSGVKIEKLEDDIKNRAILGLGVAQFYLNEFENAEMNLKDLTSRFPHFERDKVNFYLAEAYFAEGEYSSALKHYNLVSPGNSEVSKQALYGRAYTYYNLKDFANASFYFNEYATKYKNDKNYPDAMLRLADSYYGTKNFDKASEIYNEIFNSNRSLLNNDYAYYQYGQALFKSGRSSKAISEFQNLQSRFPRSRYADDSQYLVGWIYFQQSDFENARKNYERLFEKYPGSPIRPISYYSIGDCYYNTGNYDSAIVYYSKVLQQYPRSEYVFDAVNGIQYSYIAKDEADKAISFIDQYVEDNPGSEYNEQISIKKGEIYYSQGDYEKAKNAYSSFANKYPDSKYAPDAYYWIGKCASNLEQEEEAVVAFKLVIKDYLKAEVGVDAVVELSNIYMKNEQFNNVIELVDDAVSQIPQSKRIPEIQYLKASAQVKNNQLPDAYETYNNIITYYDGSIFATKSKIELGILELASQRYENAKLLFKDVGESKTNDLGAKAQYYYGVTLFEEGKINDAISALVRVRSVFSLYDEWYTRALIKLGDCYVDLNQKGQARDMYRAVLKGHKNDDFAKEANKKLKSL